jgi:putative flippase GtrA
MGIIADLFNKYREGLLYIFFGGLTTVVRWCTYALFVWLGIELNTSNILSWIIGVSFAFVVNKWYVFRSYSVKKTVLAEELVSFFSLRAVIGLVAIVAFWVLLDVGMNQSLFGVEGFIALIITSTMEIALNYLASKFIVFRKRKENA